MESELLKLKEMNEKLFMSSSNIEKKLEVCN